MDLFLESYDHPPRQIVLDMDATDDPVHGTQEGRFFHGYYGHYCYLPLYVFCDQRLILARLRPSNIDASAGTVEELTPVIAQIRRRWPKTQIVLRADSGFAREEIMAWCEANGIDYVSGLARNERLVRRIARELKRARRCFARTPRALYEDIYCARGEMENRIKEQQLDLFADRTSAATMRSNQLRLYFSNFAYVLLEHLRRVGLRGTELARAKGEVCSRGDVRRHERCQSRTLHMDPPGNAERGA